HPGLGGAEYHRLDHDPGHQEVDVVHPRRQGPLDGPAEHVGEQEHEHHRLHGREHDEVGHPQVLDEVAPGDGHGVGRGQGGCGHAACPAVGSATRPVRARNTSSSVGLCTLRSASSIPSRSRRRTTSTTTEASPRTVTATRPSASSIWVWVAAPAATSTTAAAASRTRERSRTATSTTSPPTWDLSSSAVPSAMTLPRSMTAMRSARTSASSRYWVVSRRVVPS